MLIKLDGQSVKIIIIKQFYELAFDATKIAFGSTTNIIIRYISIAGINIRLRFAGVALMPYVMPALEHLIEKENEVVPEYTIEIWDSNSTQIDFPHAPCEIDDIQVRGEIRGFTSDRFESAFFTHARMLTLIDHETKYGIVCFADTLDIPAFELACPLRGILSWILRCHQIVMVHAASVGTKDGCVLIGGNSGAGKSSTALRCLIGGFSYFGDDICAISNRNNTPTTYGIYGSGKSLSADLPLFPELIKSVHGHFEENYDKEIFFFNKEFNAKLSKSGRLVAVIIPFQDPTLEIGFQRLPLAHALSVICSSSKLLLPHAGNEMYHILSNIFHHIPCYRLNLGNDPSKIASALKSFIASL